MSVVQGLTYYNINHATSGVFQFDKIPYFLTTDDKFVQRYAFAFERNSQYSPSELLEHFQSAELTFAAMAEKRTAQRYDVVVRVQNDSEKGYDIQGLCRYRSLATQAVLDRLPDSRLDIRGGGWRKQQQKRQTLDDWHLDKLITFDKRAKFSSALENTDQPFYVTEKLFDAYAMLSVPVVHQSTTQALEQLACSHSLINVAGKKPEDLPNILQSFRLDSDFANEYGGTMQNLAGLFSHPKVLANERSAIVSRLLSELSCL
ncbi:MAG: glycosyltransferase family 10 [Gammaproteobacteria bacterium]|nr:glycosyltransferase family 10 [Gammaproteobacteria bacterium]